MAIHFKPILSKLLLLGLFLLAVQLQNSVVEAGDENMGHRYVRAALQCDTLCQALNCGADRCVDEDRSAPYCKCTREVDTAAAEKARCMPLDPSVTTVIAKVCEAICENATITNKDTPPKTYTATVCEPYHGIENCVCIPSGTADEEKLDDLVETAKAVISGLFNAIIAFVQGLVQALMDLVTSLAKFPLADILTGLVDSLKGIVGDIAGADDSK